MGVRLPSGVPKKVSKVPAKSKKQFGKIAVLYQQGKISKRTRDEFLKGVQKSKLPTRVKK